MTLARIKKQRNNQDSQGELARVVTSRANTDTHSFTDCSYHHIALVHSNFEQLRQKMGNDNSDIEQDEIASGAI